MYNLIIRPLLFCIDPEKVHRMLLSWLKFYRYLFPVRACVRGYRTELDCLPGLIRMQRLLMSWQTLVSAFWK